MGGVKVSGFTYNAEATTPPTGMLNLRARQYEPALNRNPLMPICSLITAGQLCGRGWLSAKSLGSVLSSIGSKV